MADKSRLDGHLGISNLKQAEGTLKSVSNLLPPLLSARRLDSKSSSHTARIAGSYSKLAGDAIGRPTPNYSSDEIIASQYTAHQKRTEHAVLRSAGNENRGSILGG